MVERVQAKERLILALDTDTVDDARRMIEELRSHVGVFKIGLQLFCNEGPALFEKLSADAVPIFFDGKFHDIPNTVAGAAAAIAARQVWMMNVHASGGKKMIKAAVDACQKVSLKLSIQRPKLIAVTVLTSIGQECLTDELGVPAKVDDQVCRLALLAKEAGADGVVASASEVVVLRQACGDDFMLVTPGVRPAWAGADDQSRIVTPFQAIKDGADYLVIGRPITAAADRRQAAARIIEEIEEAMGCRALPERSS